MRRCFFGLQDRKASSSKETFDAAQELQELSKRVGTQLGILVES